MSVLAAPPSIEWDEIRDSLLGRRDPSVLPPWVRLPALPPALMEFTRQAQNPQIDAAELGRIIEQDAELTGQLLRHANAAGGEGDACEDPAGTAQEAIVRLGARGSALYLLTMGMHQVLKSSESKLINFNGFWCANLERALFAREAAKVLSVDAGLAFAGAIVSDCLLPLLTNRLTPTYLRFLSGQDAQPTSLPVFEKRELGWTHAEATAHLLMDWQFPSDIVCCVLLHHKRLEIFEHPVLKRTSAAAVAIAGLLPEQMRQEPHGLKSLRKLQQACPAFDLRKLAETAQQEFEALEPGVTNPFPLARRLARLQ